MKFVKGHDKVSFFMTFMTKTCFTSSLSLYSLHNAYRRNCYSTGNDQLLDEEITGGMVIPPGIAGSCMLIKNLRKRITFTSARTLADLYRYWHFKKKLKYEISLNFKISRR
jgi:hypothetical protein